MLAAHSKDANMLMFIMCTILHVSMLILEFSIINYYQLSFCFQCHSNVIIVSVPDESVTAMATKADTLMTSLIVSHMFL